jgi:hypothetical protein
MSLPLHLEVHMKPTGKRTRLPRSLAVAALLVLALGLSACDEITVPSITVPSITLPERPGGSTAAPDTTAPETTSATETTAAPETTPAPETTAAPATTAPMAAPGTTAPPVTSVPADTTVPEEDEEEGGIPLLWVVLGISLLLILLGWIVGRSRRSGVPAAAPARTWKDHLQAGYGEALWLSDGMSEELAIWRGNALAGRDAGAAESAGTALAERWNQLGERLDRASDLLYRAEAGAPDESTAQVIRTAINQLNETRLAVDARAEARLNTRRAEAAGSDTSPAVERERLASSNLAESKSRLDAALRSLAAFR